MTRRSGARRRQRGSIDTLPSGALRVRVYAGIDPVTKQRHDLVEVIPPGPTAQREAEQARTRLLAQVDERRNPRTRATVNQLLDRWLEVLDVEPSTRQGYVRKMNKHIRPVLGGLQVGKLDAETLESFYAVLRRCRDRCGGRKYVDHRTTRKHECDEYLEPAARMAVVYTAIAAFENSVRSFVTKALLDAVGDEWWTKCVSEKIRKFAESRQADEQKTRWHGARGTDLLSYTELGHLIDIMQQNWQLFEPMVLRIDWARALFAGIERSRNVIMHSGVLDIEDVERVGMYIRDWTKQVGL